MTAGEPNTVQRWQQTKERLDNIDLKLETNPKSQWTLAKEIYGTLIATSPLIIGLVVWGSDVNKRMSVLEMRVDMAEVADRRRDADAAEQRRELLQKLERIGVQIEVLQQGVARLGASPRQGETGFRQGQGVSTR